MPARKPTWRSRLTRARKRAVRDGNRLIAPLETIGARGDGAPLPYPPVFVVGPPRSGTTLLVQVMIAALDVGYFSNLMNAVWGAPTVAVRLGRAFGWRGRDEFTSRLGNTRAWLGFSEAPNYWLRFFPETPHCLAAGDVPGRDLERLRVAVGRLVRAFGKPVVFKTIANAGRLGPLAVALPEARFLVSRRDLAEIGHSLLEARRERFGDYDSWLSFEPPGIEELRRRPAHEQVIETALRTYEKIRADAEAIGPERFLEVRYEDLCDDPHGVLTRVARFAGLATREAWRERVPARFGRRNEVRIPAELHERMLAYCRRVTPGAETGARAG